MNIFSTAVVKYQSNKSSFKSIVNVLCHNSRKYESFCEYFWSLKILFYKKDLQVKLN